MNKHSEVYSRQPLRVESGIPIYADDDNYVANYKRIGADHVKAIAAGIENPFMNPALWRESEESTRVLVRRYLSQSARILDVGVGLGRLLGPFLNYRRYGVDISLDYLRYARDAGIDAVFARSEDLPYHSDTFDVVCCSDVLEHVFDLYRCTNEMLRVLKPNGLLIARVPYCEPLSSYLADDAPYAFVHVRNFDLESLKLHFCKIFGCRWVEHTLTSHEFFDADRLAIRLPTKDSELERFLHGSGRSGGAYAELVSILPSSQSDLIATLKNLQNLRPKAFSNIIREFMLPLEINVVLQKVTVEQQVVSNIDSAALMENGH